MGNEQYAIEMLNITKRFPGIIANDNITLQLRHGEIHALLGENGAGKSTLMSVLFGLYQAEEGIIKKDGVEVKINDPNDANALGIGMVHQHFKLVECFTVLENIILGVEPNKAGFLQKDQAREKVMKLSEQYGLHVDPDALIEDITVGMQQRTEILKMLYRDNEILIFDEPTAVLTPQETRKLFTILCRMRDDGKAIIIITHKLHEVLALSDRVSVLRKGEYIGTVKTSETNESQLTEMMVGKKISLNIERSEPQNPEARLEVKDLSCVNREGTKLLSDVTFTAYSGEILGIAGIAGSGQRELLESIAGLQPVKEGNILYNNPKNGKIDNLRDKTPLQIRELGVRLSFVPEDRLGMGLVGNMDIVDNMMLRSYRKGKTFLLERKQPKDLAQKIINDLEVVTPGASTPVRRLSGGNVQKVLVGREIAASPTVFMAAYPVRGLDINSSYLIYNLLNKQKESGVAVIFVGEDLDVLLELCDRILVINSGKVTGIVDARTATKEEVGLLMTKNDGGENHEQAE